MIESQFFLCWCLINPQLVCCWLLIINSNCYLLPELYERVPRNKGSKKRISQRLINLQFAIMYIHNYACWGRVICQIFYTSKIPNPLNFTQYLVDLQLLKVGGKKDGILDHWEVGGRVQLEPSTPQPPDWNNSLEIVRQIRKCLKGAWSEILFSSLQRFSSRTWSPASYKETYFFLEINYINCI